MAKRDFINCELNLKNEKMTFSMDSQYDALRIINKNGQGYIIKAYDTSNQRLVAVKMIKEMYDPYNIKRIYREFVIAKTVKHKNLITLLDAFTPEGKNMYFVYEYMDASMRDYLKLPSSDINNLTNIVWNPNTGDYFTANILFQFFCGLRYLHQDKLKFIHRDIKPENILIKRLSGGNWHLKIHNLALARQLQEGDVNITNDFITCPYRAPEVMIGDLYSSAIDLWPVGCILAEMITGNILFKKTDQTNQFLQILHLVGFPEGTNFPTVIKLKIENESNRYGSNKINSNFGDDKLPNWTKQRITKEFVRNLLKYLLEFDPNTRLTAEQGTELLQFEFLEDRSGKNNIAPLSHNPIDEGGPHTVSEWRQLINEKLNDYEIKRFQN